MKWEILLISRYPMIFFSKLDHSALTYCDRFLDGDTSNPWLYMHKQLEECEESALNLAKRKKHLMVL